MTTLASPAAPVPETPSVEAAPSTRAWLGWGVAAAGFAALALSFVVSLTQARAEQVADAAAFAVLGASEP
jgi:hypothetical protein